jgi:hypothetical protein
MQVVFDERTMGREKAFTNKHIVVEEITRHAVRNKLEFFITFGLQLSKSIAVLLRIDRGRKSDTLLLVFFSSAIEQVMPILEEQK